MLALMFDELTAGSLSLKCAKHVHRRHNIGIHARDNFRWEAAILNLLTWNASWLCGIAYGSGSPLMCVRRYLRSPVSRCGYNYVNFQETELKWCGHITG